MGLFGRKDVGPKIVCCPNCSGSQEVSASAQSVVCRHCNVTIKVCDQKITNYSATVALEITGSLVIEKKGALVVQKRVVASDLMLRGSLKGNSVVYEKAHIAAGAQLVGDLKARILTVEDGASLKGHLHIVPGDGSVIIEQPKELAGRVRSG